MQFFAEASTNSQPSCFARALPSCVETSLSVTRSHLLPTSMTGAGPKEEFIDWESGDPGYVGDPAPADSFTLCIWLWNFSMRAKDAREEMLYTSTKPSPSRIHWSRNAVYSSCPAVSRTSSMHDCWSITTCLR